MRKKIFYINGTTLPGGGPEHIYQLIKKLNRNEWEPSLCTKKNGTFWEKFYSMRIKLYDLSLRKLSLLTLFKLFFILKKERPDLIHTHGKGPGLYGRIIGKFLSIPVVHTFHGFHYEDLPYFTRWLHLLVDSFLSLITAKHIFVSAGEKNRARKIKFLDEHNSTVIHNGVDCELIQNISIEKNEIFESIGCDDWKHNKILGTISRISPEKGMHNLLSAFSKVIQKIPDLRLIIVGGYPEEHKNYYLKMTSFIKKEDLTEHVRILGYRKDALEILKCMDFYISPSLSEGLPISILEAISSRIPIVATEIAGNKDILRNSAFGILVEPNSPECLSLGIIRITQLTQNELNILTRNAYNRIKKEFSVEEMASKTVLLYKKILRKNDAYERTNHYVS